MAKLDLTEDAIDALMNREPYDREGNIRRFEGKHRGKTYRLVVEVDAGNMVYTVFSLHHVRKLKPGEKPKPRHRRQ